MKSKKSKSNIPGTKVGRLQIHVLPILVWLMSLFCVVGLYSHRTQTFEVVGVVQGQYRNISSVASGTLKTLHAELFKEVRKGEILAILDDEQLQANIVTARAEIQRLNAEITAERDRLTAEAKNNETDYIGTYRSFQIDVERSRLGILQIKTTLETDRVTLRSFKLEKIVTQELIEKDAVAQYELQKIEIMYDALASTIEQNENLLEQYQLDLATAQERRDSYASRQPVNPSITKTLDITREAINVQETLIAELSLQSKALVLTSPIDGIVSQIINTAGETVLPGVPILIVSEPLPENIIAYAHERNSGQIKVNAKVELVKNSISPQMGPSQVVYVGPVMELKPERLWNHPDMPEWGRPFLVKIPSGMQVVPGERVAIRVL